MGANETMYDFYFQRLQTNKESSLISSVFLRIKEIAVHGQYGKHQQVREGLMELKGCLELLQGDWFPRASGKIDQHFLISIPSLILSLYGTSMDKEKVK